MKICLSIYFSNFCLFHAPVLLWFQDSVVYIVRTGGGRGGGEGGGMY